MCPICLGIFWHILLVMAHFIIFSGFSENNEEYVPKFLIFMEFLRKTPIIGETFLAFTLVRRFLHGFFFFFFVKWIQGFFLLIGGYSLMERYDGKKISGAERGSEERYFGSLK